MEKIRKRLKELKMTQQELADKTGISQGTISRFINRTPESVVIYLKIAKELGIG